MRFSPRPPCPPWWSVSIVQPALKGRATAVKPSRVERLAASVRQRTDDQRRREEEGRRAREREADADSWLLREDADHVRRERTSQTPRVVARPLPRRTHRRRKQLRDEAPEHIVPISARVRPSRSATTPKMSPPIADIASVTVPSIPAVASSKPK